MNAVLSAATRKAEQDEYQRGHGRDEKPGSPSWLVDWFPMDERQAIAERTIQRLERFRGRLQAAKSLIVAGASDRVVKRLTGLPMVIVEQIREKR